MAEERYTVSQVEQLTGIKGHVLRYWEEELELVIGRNNLGHRCYTRYDVQMFLNIKELKSRGMQLKGIKELLPRISKKGPGASGAKVKLLETEEGAVWEPDQEEEEAKDQEAKERMARFQQILERLIREELRKKNHEERRCRTLDEAIRMHQQTRKQAAAAKEEKRKSRRIFKKHRKKAKKASL